MTDWVRLSQTTKETDMSKPHKWAKEIHAFADGKVIEWRDPKTDEGWREIETPAFFLVYEYRVKPEPKPLWEVARDAYCDHDLAGEEGAGAWAAAADAVVAAYLEQQQ